MAAPKKKTTAKSAPRKSSATKAAPAAEAPVAPVPSEAGAEAEAKTLRVKGPTMRLKELLEQVSEATGGKKKDVKAIVEATLKALGEGLAKGEDLNLPGLGRARVARSAERGDASVLTLKLRRSTHPQKDAKEPLADDEDDG